MTAPTVLEHRYVPRGAAKTVFECRAAEVVLSGPAGCVAGETELFDPVAGRGRRIDELCACGERPWVLTLNGPVLAEAPFFKGVAPLYRVTLASGVSNLVTADHLFLSREGWVSISAGLAVGVELLSASHVDAHHWSGKPEGSHAPCFNCPINGSHYGPVVSIKFERTDAFFDLCVPVEEHYLADGMWSHNTGKSRAALEKLHLLALLNRGMRGLIVRKTLSSLGSTGLVTWREKVIPEALEAGDVRFFGGSMQEAAQYRYANGSSVTIGGLDKATKVMSSEYDVIFVQEAIELAEGDWEALTTRLRNGRISFQQLLADTNPDRPTHWLKARCDRGQTTMLHSRHEDNPVLFDDQGRLTEAGAAYIGKLDALTGVRKERLRYGRWVAAEGLVYEEYDPAVHLRPINDPPHAWTRWWVVDFGYTNPFVLQCWAEDPDGRLYLYRELYHTRRLVEDHARQALGIVTRRDGSWKEPKPRAVICDHDAEDRATLERHLGMSTVPAHKSVSDGIQAVQQRLRVAGDGKPRVYFNPDALVERDPELEAAKLPTCTVEEIPGYVWDRGPTTGAAAAKPPKEVPVKRDDHGVDCVRYLVADRDLAARPRVRFLG